MNQIRVEKRAGELLPGWDLIRDREGLVLSCPHLEGGGTLRLENGSGPRVKAMLYLLATDLLERGIEPARAAAKPSLPDVETLADLIREIDGNGSLSLGARNLAQGLIDKLGEPQAG